jgi:hypothetical protein
VFDAVEEAIAQIEARRKGAQATPMPNRSDRIGLDRLPTRKVPHGKAR